MQSTDPKQLPVIDPAYRGQPNLLDVFIKQLSKTKLEINYAFQTKQALKMRQAPHYLSGSCIYCGLLRL
jgi:hypothetical protein